MWFFGKGKSHTKLTYAAAENTSRRKSIVIERRAEDRVLGKAPRERLISGLRDHYRNLSLVTWAINKHLDYVSRFDLHTSRTLPPEFRMRLESLFDWHSQKRNFDVAGRHSRQRALKMFELHKVIDGDAFWLKSDSGHIQPIEGELIAKPQQLPQPWEDQVTEHGLILDPVGRVISYCKCTRGISGYEFERMLDASNVISDGYFWRYDQTRGVSPITSAANSFADLHDLHNNILLKARLHALFGLAISREVVPGDGYDDESNTTNDSTTGGYAFDLSKPVNVLDLDPGDKVDTLESATPNGAVEEYSEAIIRIALGGLGIPYSLYNSKGSSYNARQADRTEYEDSCQPKRDANRSVLTEYSDWCLARWLANASLLGDLATKYKLSFWDIKSAVEWIPAGTPWTDKLKEAQGDQIALANGLDSRQRILKRRGQDYFRIVDELAEEEAYAQAKKVTITLGQPGQTVITDNPADAQATGQ